MSDVTVRLQALDGAWETCGADRAIGVVPESLTAAADSWGPSKASFDLKRSVIALWPDLSYATPVEIEVAGLVWEGYIAETPSRGGAEQIINVQCEGWQYHLDDDVYRRTYVHSKLSDWKDIRSHPEANLAIWTSAFQAQVGAGKISLSSPNGSVVVGESKTAVGVILDLGPGQTAAAVAMTFKGIATAGNYKVFIRCSATVNGLTGSASEYSEAVGPFDPGSFAEETKVGTFAEPARYIGVFMDRSTASTTEIVDQTLTITAASVFTDTSYEEGGKSVLTASTIVRDGLRRATLLLSSDLSGIEDTEFDIEDFDLSKPSTPREAFEAANAFHNWIAKIGVGRRVIFTPRPKAPTLEIGAWSQSSTADPSANSGEQIYNRVLVEGTMSDGTPLLIERTAGQQPGVIARPLTTPVPGNPSFAVNTATWSGAGLARDTVIYNSPPASGRSKVAAGLAHLTETFTGTFEPGIAYTLRFYLASSRLILIGCIFGEGSDRARVEAVGTEAFKPVTIVWTPSSICTAVTLQVGGTSTLEEKLWVDDLSLSAAQPTILDRHGRKRTKVIQMSSPVTVAEAEQIADTFLQSHMTTPFKDEADITYGSIRTVIGGETVHPFAMLLKTQELIRFGHLIDPDTGGVGRDGTIAEATYTHREEKTRVVLDDKRANFDALMARLDVVQSVGS